MPGATFLYTRMRWLNTSSPSGIAQSAAGAACSSHGANPFAIPTIAGSPKLEAEWQAFSF